jgi:hypothetical protein
LTPTQAHVESLTCGASFFSKVAKAEAVPTARSSICAENTETSHPIQVVLGIEMFSISKLSMAYMVSKGSSPKRFFFFFFLLE